VDDYKNKPGSALASLIPDWAVQFKGGCKCRDMQVKMDRFGTALCKDPKKYEMIVDHLVNQSDRLIPVLRGIPKSLRERGARKLLDKAISMSE
jgi:hypothetical protein